MDFSLKDLLNQIRIGQQGNGEKVDAKQKTESTDQALKSNSAFYNSSATGTNTGGSNASDFNTDENIPNVSDDMLKLFADAIANDGYIDDGLTNSTDGQITKDDSVSVAMQKLEAQQNLLDSGIDESVQNNPFSMNTAPQNSDEAVKPENDDKAEETDETKNTDETEKNIEEVQMESVPAEELPPFSIPLMEENQAGSLPPEANFNALNTNSQANLQNKGFQNTDGAASSGKELDTHEYEDLSGKSQGELQNLKGQAESFRNESAAADVNGDKQVKAAENGVKRAETNAKNAATAADNAQNTARNAKTSKENADKNVENKEQLVETLKDKMDGAVKSQAEKELGVETSEMEKTQLEEKAAEIDEKLNGLEQKKTELEENQTQKQTEIEETQANIEETNANISQTEGEISATEGEITATEAAIGETEAELAAAQAAEPFSAGAVAALEARLAQEQAQLQQEQVRLQQEQAKLQQLQTQLQQQQEQLQTKQQELEQIGQEIQTNETDLQNTQTEKQTNETEKQAKDTEIQQKKTELEQVKQGIQLLDMAQKLADGDLQGALEAAVNAGVYEQIAGKDAADKLKSLEDALGTVDASKIILNSTQQGVGEFISALTSADENYLNTILSVLDGGKDSSNQDTVRRNNTFSRNSAQNTGNDQAQVNINREPTVPHNNAAEPQTPTMEPAISQPVLPSEPVLQQEPSTNEEIQVDDKQLEQKTDVENKVDDKVADNNITAAATTTVDTNLEQNKIPEKLHRPTNL